jgi:hypothetical protein
MSSVGGATPTFPATNPAFTGGYVFSDDEIAGVVAANNFIALTNPTGSGKVILIAGVFISSIAVAGITAAAPLRGYRATAVSAGTLQAASAIGKIRTTMPDPVGEIRVGNPTATLGAAWFNSPAVLASGLQSAPFVHQVPATIAAGSLTLLPGESTVLRTESGDVDSRWNISIAWSEL